MLHEYVEIVHFVVKKVNLLFFVESSFKNDIYENRNVAICEGQSVHSV